MTKSNNIPQPLTVSEAKELHQLKEQIFQGAKFLIVDEEERKKPHVQRYEELLKKKMAYLKYMFCAPALN